MENQTIINIVVILALIVTFSTIIVLNPETGESLDPTHYCNSIGIKMYCARTTAYYCYPSNETRIGSKKCNEGWKDIPVSLISKRIDISPKERCTPSGCEQI